MSEEEVMSADDKQEVTREAAEASATEAQAADESSGSVADEWAAAMAEQSGETDGGAAADSGEAGPSSAGSDVFKPFENAAGAGTATRDLETVMDIPVKLNVELGRTRITIKELLELTEGSVVELDGLAGDPMDILINGHLVAQGEVVVVDDKYGIRITEIITSSERIQKLNR